MIRHVLRMQTLPQMKEQRLKEAAGICQTSRDTWRLCMRPSVIHKSNLQLYKYRTNRAF